MLNSTLTLAFSCKTRKNFSNLSYPTEFTLFLLFPPLAFISRLLSIFFTILNFHKYLFSLQFIQYFPFSNYLYPLCPFNIQLQKCRSRCVSAQFLPSTSKKLNFFHFATFSLFLLPFCNDIFFPFLSFFQCYFSFYFFPSHFKAIFLPRAPQASDWFLHFLSSHTKTFVSL